MEKKHGYLKDGIPRREFLKVTGMGLGSVLAFPGLVRGSPKWPERPITVAIGHSPGGGTDTVLRAFCAPMEKNLHATINCSNVTGLGGAMAEKFIWNKPSDGYWWSGASDYHRPFRALGQVDRVPWNDWVWFKACNSIHGWAVRSDSPFKNLGDVVDYAKKHPGKLNFSCAAIGGMWHVGSIHVMNATGTKWEMVPYGGGYPAAVAALKGEVDVASNGIHEQVEFLKAGKLRNLAVFTDKPLEVEGVGTLKPVTDFVPEVKTFCPNGASYSTELKRDVSVEILKKIEEAFLAAMDDPGFNDVLKKRVMFKNVKTGAEADKEVAMNEINQLWLFWRLGLGKVNPKDLGVPRPEEFEEWWPPKDYKPRI